MNDIQLGKLIDLLTALRRNLSAIWKENYDVEINIGSSSMGDHTKVTAEIIVPKNKDVRKPK